MGDRPDLDALADACVRAMKAVKAHGTPAMERVMRVLLFQVGRELAKTRRQAPKNDGCDGEA